MVKPTFYIFSNPHNFEYIYLEILSKWNMYTINAKNSYEKVISSKQYYMSIISNTSMSTTGWDLIQNNNDLNDI